MRMCPGMRAPRWSPIANCIAMFSLLLHSAASTNRSLLSACMMIMKSLIIGAAKGITNIRLSMQTQACRMPHLSTTRMIHLFRLQLASMLACALGLSTSAVRIPPRYPEMRITFRSDMVILRFSCLIRESIELIQTPMLRILRSLVLNNTMHLCHG